MITEADIQRALTGALQIKGFELIHHELYSLGSKPGFPDLIAIKPDPGLLVVIEVKGPRGKLGPMQQNWIDGFAAIPGCVFAEIVGPTTTDTWMGYEEALAFIGGQL